MIIYVLVEDKELRFVFFSALTFVISIYKARYYLAAVDVQPRQKAQHFLGKKIYIYIIFIRGIPPSFSGLLDEEESLCVQLIIQNSALLEEPDYCGIAVTKANKLF